VVPGRRSGVLAHCIVLALAFASCADASSAPAAVLGRWVSDDARFANRTLEIGSHVVRFVDGNAELDAIVIHGVEVTREPGTPQRIEIAGHARDGAEVELVLELQTQPTERLRIETQTATWHRAAPSGLGAAQ
jgi:hypothetical protein